MSVLLARQPIVDANGRLFGYELLFRSPEGNAPNGESGELATATVLWNAMVEIGLDRFGQGHPLFVNVPDALLGSEALDAVPRNRLVVEVLETTAGGAGIRDELSELNRRGIRIALDDFCGGRQTPLLPLVDFVKVHVNDQDAIDTFRRMSHALQGQRLIAECVETREDVDRCREMGIDLFQGYYFAKPRPIEGSRTRMGAIAQMRLLSALQKQHITVAEVERLLSQDPELCYRVLRFATSAFAGRSRRVSTIREALVIGGFDRLRSLASALVLAGISGEDLVRPTQSLIRARFCEALAERRGLAPGTGFLVGLFSGLDALAVSTREELVRDARVSDEVACALIGHEGAFGDLLEVSLGYERAATALDSASSSLAEARIYLEAVQWAEQLVTELGTRR